jgi:hypothetical protein
MPLSPSYFFLILLLIPASYYDLRRREIPSWLNHAVLGVIILYTVFAARQNPWFLLYSIYAFLVPYFLWRFGILGGGDAKLLTLACLLLAVPVSPDMALPLLFISLSYIIHFITPNPELLKKSWAWLILLPIVGILARDLLAPIALLVFFSMKMAELNAIGYAESISLENLRPHHLVREALKDGDVVGLSDIDVFLRRKGYDYVPPLMLDEKDVERIKKLWMENGREDVRVARERPAIPAILAASVLYRMILG